MKNDAPVLDRPSNSLAEQGSIPDDVMDGTLSPESKHVLSSMMLSVHSERRIISGIDKIAEKLTEAHIDKIIENAAKDDERSFAAFKMRHILGGIIFGVSLAFAFSLILLFRESEHFLTILASIFSFLGGLGVGRLFPGNRDRQ